MRSSRRSLGRLLWGCFCLLLAAAQAPAAAQTAAPAEVISLNGEWRFALAPNPAEAERMAQFHQPAFNAEAFRPLPVPSNWAMHGFEEPLWIQQYRGPNGRVVLAEPSEAEGFYLHRFPVPQGAAGKRAVLHFDGVWSSAEVWLNGQPIGRHDSGFTGFQFDVADQLRPGAENVLAVRVRQRTPNARLDVNDDWALGGIYRDVRLEFMPREMFIERFEVETKFDRDFRDANLNLRIFLGRFERPPQAFGARVTLADASGAAVARAEHTGTIQGCGFVVCGQEVPLTIPVRAPRHWTVETPDLYTVRVELLAEGRVVHAREARIGFREVSTAGGVLSVNGHPVRLRGVGRHDLHPDVGRATRPEHWRQDIELMKAANINAVRTTHYPPAQGFLALCDELGLYVMDEVPLGFGGDLLLDQSLAGPVLLRAHETVRRDRNHPSVIMWSIGNEDPMTDLHLAAIRTVKGADPTRPVLMPWRAESTMPPEVDILAPHYRSAEDYDRLAATSPRPVVTTEYTHALGGHDFGGLEERWEALTRHPAGAGGMIWLWQDQGIRRRVNGRPVLDALADLGKYKAVGRELVLHSPAGEGEIYDAHGVFGADGIVNPDRSLQRDYWETRAVYAPVRVTVSELPYRAGQRSAFIPVRNDYDFTNLSALRVRWQLMRDDVELRSGEARLDAGPRTTKALEVPLDAMGSLTPAAYHVQLSFRRENGSEVVARSVRLVTEGPGATIQAATAPATFGPAPARAQVSRGGPLVTVTVGNTAYSFDPATAQISGVTVNGEALVTGARPTIWRSMTISELRQFRGGDENETPLAPELDRYRTTVRKWNVAESPEGVRIEAEAEHRVDERNAFTARYDYLVDPSGALRVRYSIKPGVQINWLPEIGMRFETAPGLNALRWAGLGPIESAPNLQAAARFGVWSARTGTAEIEGARSRVEWAELTGTSGNGLRVVGAPFVQLEAAPGAAGTFRVLSEMSGRSNKFQKPERPEHRIDLAPDREFVGGFTLNAQRPARLGAVTQ